MLNVENFSNIEAENIALVPFSRILFAFLFYDKVTCPEIPVNGFNEFLT